MTATAWASLPNAAYIDWVLADVSKRPEVWNAAWDAVRDAARDGVLGAARDAAWGAAWAAHRDAARDVVLDAAWAAARGVARTTVMGAVLAFIAYDDAGIIVKLPVSSVRLYADCGHPAAILLLPAAIARGDDNACQIF